VSKKKAAIEELLKRKTSPLDNTEIQKTLEEDNHKYRNTVLRQPIAAPTTTVPEKKKATFELDADLHKRLKMYSAQEGKKMVDVVEEALTEYLISRNP
jgi:hypothetical protein